MKKFLSKVVIMLVGILLGLGGLEIGTRIVAPQIFPNPKVWRYEANLGWEHIPGAEDRWLHRDFDVSIKINSKGLRDVERDYAKKDNTFRILAFGDSFVEGWGVELEDSVTRRLEEILNLQGGDKKYEVVNCSVAGYGTDQELLFFQREGVKYSPDLVIVFFYLNDVGNNASKIGIGTEKGFKPYFQLRNGKLVLKGVPVPRSLFWDEDRPKPQEIVRRIDLIFWDSSHLYNLVRSQFTEQRIRDLSVRYYVRLYSDVYHPKLNYTWMLTKALIGKLSDEVESRGGKMLVVTVPAKMQVHTDEWEKRKRELEMEGQYDLYRPNRMISDYCQKAGIPILDLLPEFVEQVRDGKHLFYPRDTHWSPEGHKLAAELIGSYLTEMNLISMAGDTW